MSARPNVSMGRAGTLRLPERWGNLDPASGEGQRALRTALGRFATGVTVIATRCGEDRVHGMTVNSFTSLSLDPALVLWTLRRGSARYETFAHCDLFSVNVLAEHQVDIARRYARAAPGATVSTWQPFRADCPVVEGASAQFVCRRRNVVREGDHAILIGEILDFIQLDAKPLLFVAGDYFSGAALTRI